MAGDTRSQNYQSKVDSYGFERSQEFDYESYEDFMASYLSVLSRRAKKWQELLDENDGIERSPKVKRYIRKGIPGEHRGMIWATVSGAKDLKDQNPDVYTNLLHGEKNEQLVNTIKIDIPRTFPDNIYFQNVPEGQQQALYNVLIAFAHHNSHVGYCQGLNYIAGMLLIIVKDEEITFWLLTVLVNKILPDYYTKDMHGLLTDMETLGELVRLKIPSVHRLVNQVGLTWPIIATKWFVCLYAEVLPIETVLRIWDCLFYEGNKILFRVSLALIKINQKQLLKHTDFSSLAESFKEIVNSGRVMDCHTFMQAIFREPGRLPMSSVTKLRQTCSQRVKENQSKLLKK